jgi:hypothetical protein
VLAELAAAIALAAFWLLLVLLIRRDRGQVLKPRAYLVNLHGLELLVPPVVMNAIPRTTARPPSPANPNGMSYLGIPVTTLPRLDGHGW